MGVSTNTGPRAPATEAESAPAPTAPPEPLTQDACLDRLRDLRYPPGTSCPTCGRPSRFHRVRGRSAFACQHCGRHVYPTAGTVFERSPIDLPRWVRAVELVRADRAAATPEVLARELGVTPRTATRMLERVLPLAEIEGEPLLAGVRGTPPARRPRRAARAAEAIPDPVPQPAPILRPPAPGARRDGAASSTLLESVRGEVVANLAVLRSELEAAEQRARVASDEVDRLRALVARLERLAGE
jgi:transposase-like protein